MPMHNYFPGVTGTGLAVWMIVSALFWLGVAAVVIWALVRLANRFSRGTGASGPTVQPSAAEILKARYARGEIDEGTFREMMAQLAATDEAAAPTNKV